MIRLARPRLTRAGLALGFAALTAIPATPVRLAAQDGPELRMTGLFRGGLRLARQSLGGRDGFRLYDVRSGVTGRVGILFDYVLVAEYDTELDRVRLLDGYLTLPIRPDGLLDLQLGQLKSPYGREALIPRAEIPFVERSQASTALAPARQVGVRLRGVALEGRVSWWAGAFNGNGRQFENDNDDLLYVARFLYNSIGDIAFYDELVWQLGAGVAFSRDSALGLLPVVAPRAGLAPPLGRGGGSPALAEFTGERLLWGVDATLAYRGWFLNAEYLRGDFDVDGEAAAVPLEGGGEVTPGEELSAEGFYVEVGRRFLAAFEGIVRYDAFRAADGVEGEARRSRFLMLGLNVYPGVHAKIGFQYAAGVDGSRIGRSLADGEFLTNFQLAF